MERRPPHDRVRPGDKVTHASGLKHGVVAATTRPVTGSNTLLPVATVDWDGEGREEGVVWGLLEVIP